MRDENTLPMDDIPSGWGFTELTLYHNVRGALYRCVLTTCTDEEPFVDAEGFGRTPRRAMFGAIETALTHREPPDSP